MNTISTEEIARMIESMPKMRKTVRWRVAPQVVEHFHGVNESRVLLGLPALLWPDFTDRFANGRDLFT